MIFVDALLRFATVGLLGGLLLLLVRDARALPAARVGILLCISQMAQAVFASPKPISPPPEVALVAAFLAVPAPALLWLFWVMLLDDGQRLRPIYLAVVALACLFKLGWALEFAGIALPCHALRYAGTYAIGVGLMTHIMYLSVSGRQDDMVEERRRTRLVVALVVMGAGVLNLAVELSKPPEAAALIAGNALGVVALLTIGWWLVSLDRAQLQPAVPVGPDSLAVPAKDRATYEQLIAALEERKAYLRPDLTIGRLARQVGVPEHQLRALINRTLGHRNFASFINGYRLAHAKTLLADPGAARLPILTIAYDSGFQTLSTFNRAFRAQCGEAPSAYRRRMLECRPDTATTMADAQCLDQA